MMNIDVDNVTVIPPDADIDSYALLKGVDNVVSFGSSVGIEASFWGKPSILLGPCFYRNLGGTYQPHDHQQAMNLLAARLDPLPADGALKYGYWFQTHGFAFKYFEADGLFEGKFKGQIVYARKRKRMSDRLRRVVEKIRSVGQGRAARTTAGTGN